ncbi:MULTISPECIES: AbrB/MazE/SpoVT family DNA-binding domain-containing protein [Rhizobium]|jgi:AbrB family looped-hinge helix DNA binding protein|uniref:Looped-hinge helix DNA binding domain-containing protein, AbrB family n=1 Tax=Rhizobium lusitanum TaxID=293958 RepID=A0A1C3UU69_9HYPH|nr:MULTISPECIES: AbrB/MazE/SpoVT family DNA-binding domain-containing protein [Rhizobium]NKJ03414.1 AbrB family looped-hinge helix DNA binding protein [Rhizobium sp. SG741]NKJ33605.1 AbrB family looped-hinge helix DNA binding protein [Rhizobium sp. SG570]SCB18847.1 looped-hinge helix DNA binding domain-containing protein, AbrB family [Rhizobium lusitanum]
MRVTEKGQVTIPKEIRDRLGIGPGSEVDFIASGSGAMLVKIAEASDPAIRDFDDWLERVGGTMDLGGMTTDEFMEFLRGPRDDVDPR